MPPRNANHHADHLRELAPESVWERSYNGLRPRHVRKRTQALTNTLCAGIRAGFAMLLTGFGDVIAERIRAEHVSLASRWFERLSMLLPVAPDEVFPSGSLLDHIPALIVDISEYLRAPEEDAIAANAAVLQKARELGMLRHEQRASLHQVLREYQLLDGVLVSFVGEETARLVLAPAATEIIAVVARLHQAANVLMQTTVETFVGLYTKRIAEQAERLEQFTRMAAHEWRQPLSSLQFAATVLRRAAQDPDRAGRAFDALDRNISHLIEITRKIEELARMESDAKTPESQEVALATVTKEAARQLREMADARGVDVRVSDRMPSLRIDVGRLELALLNLLSNAIKYSDPEKNPRFVDVSATEVDAKDCCIVIRDNGLGIPRDSQACIFEQFSRAHADLDDAFQITGMGLGLSIVDDCVRAMNGRIEVESEEGAGTVFVLTLPSGKAP